MVFFRPSTAAKTMGTLGYYGHSFIVYYRHFRAVGLVKDFGCYDIVGCALGQHPACSVV